MKSTKWLFNFSNSPTGGGLNRLKEYAKWFAEREGATFLINIKVKYTVNWPDGNTYYFVNINNLSRLVTDTPYLKAILLETGKPDVYFSYGIPIEKKIGALNWFHLSNALTLSTYKISLPLSLKVKQKILGMRLMNNIENIDVFSAESNFSINLFNNSIKNKFKKTTIVLQNGYDLERIISFMDCTRNDSESYAITIGTQKYKRIDVVYDVFLKLKERSPRLNNLFIIGNEKDLNNSLVSNPDVTVLSNIKTSELFNLLFNSEYFISASEIENGSLAALEGMLLAKNAVISAIPPHYELLSSAQTEIIIDEKSKMKLHLVHGDITNIITEYPSWDDICLKMVKFAHIKTKKL